MNSSTYTGRIVADAEMKTSQSGNEYCRFRLASDVGFGENKKTHWLDCALFGNRGKTLCQYLKKGTSVVAAGSLEPPRLYETQAGETRVSQSLILNDVALMSEKKTSAAPATETETTRATAPAPRTQYTDEEVPF
ncbi:single-stranded DNA-binding protein [Thiospirillum jenense]|uniref:Single-stranded DNA-binding protein n=1 Tax=Thiospirillum jenense TaxID=1653858 RepID=A0A839HBF1_9GAMM|nr:single-stranded DNA-binding protein [Thiospirillum jenense]MBB1125530.1 single-stranded DNA-binding protein [Thiospirillum jenense]